MNTFLAFIIFLIPLCGVAQQSEESRIQKLKDEVLKTDIAFNKMCQTEGFSKAFIEFAAADVILMRQNQFPIVGFDALKDRFSKLTSQPKLSWYPRKADASASGDLGYTFGNWELVSKTASGSDTTSYGVYITVWKKQINGKWKYVFDGGNDTPKPSGLK